MHIGFDFDNTIINYNSIFHKVALDNGLITPEVPVNKVSVRDYLRNIGKESLWTEMQGYVYGSRIEEAEVFPGVLECLEWTLSEGIEVSIVSHKTLYPILGNRYDLHHAASNWIIKFLTNENGPLINPNMVYFELTKKSKLLRIRDIGCTVYVDDLPEILKDKDFPQNTAKLLFDPDDHHHIKDLSRASHWKDVRSYLENLWKSQN
jgi:phosphoserine phosphatase